VRVRGECGAERVGSVARARHVDAEGGTAVVLMLTHHRPPITRARSAGLRPSSRTVSMLSMFSGLSAAFVTGRSCSAQPPSGEAFGSAFLTTNRSLDACESVTASITLYFVLLA